jgi:putative ABC transport system substrate-binding protein
VGYWRETDAAAQGLGVQTLPLEFKSPDELDATLDGAITGQADGLIVTAGAAFSSLAPRIVAWAAGHRLPAMYAISPFGDAGGLMTYAANVVENWHRAAVYVDKIFKGARPGDLPVEKPTVFDLVINLTAAQALGLTIEPSVLQQATQVIR